MKTAANKMWKKIAVFTMALTVMCGTVTVMGKTTGASFVTAAYEEQQEEAFEIQSCEHGKLHAELVEGDDQEFNAILVTPEPDAGYKVKAVYANGAQVAINDNDEYLIAYTGEKVVLWAEFIEDEDTEAFEIMPCEHGKLHAQLVEGDDQEFNAILVTPEPDAGYKVAAVYANGAQVAINDNDEYLIAYTGEKLILSAEFVPISEDPGSKADTDSVPKTGAAAAGLGVAGAAVAVAALAVLRRKK